MWSGSGVTEPSLRLTRSTCPDQPLGIRPAPLAGHGGSACGGLRHVYADRPFKRFDLRVLQGVVGADLDALGGAAAEIAVVRDVLRGVEAHDAEGAGDQAHLAADAPVVVHGDLAGSRVAADGVGGAVAHAGGVRAVEAGEWQVHSLFYEVVHEDASPGGLERPFVLKGASALAQVAGHTLLGMGEDHLHEALRPGPDTLGRPRFTLIGCAEECQHGAMVEICNMTSGRSI